MRCGSPGKVGAPAHVGAPKIAFDPLHSAPRPVPPPDSRSLSVIDQEILEAAIRLRELRCAKKRLEGS